MRTQYERQVASMHAKLLWYADNQTLLSDNEALLGEQSRLITELRARLEAGSRGASQRRIADLQTHVCSARPCMRCPLHDAAASAGLCMALS